MRDKLIRLQSLYIDQFKRLHHLLRNKRYYFLHQTNASRGRPSRQSMERDGHNLDARPLPEGADRGGEEHDEESGRSACSPSHCAPVTLANRTRVEGHRGRSVCSFEWARKVGRVKGAWGARLRALRHYQRRFGVEALLQRQCRARRLAVSEGLNDTPDTLPRCAFTDTVHAVSTGLDVCACQCVSNALSLITSYNYCIFVALLL